MDGEVAKNGPSIDCDGSGTTNNVYTRLDSAVANATGDPAEVRVCPGTYGSDQDIYITADIQIDTVGTGSSTVQSLSDDGDQGASILIEETSAEEIRKVEIKGLSVQHSSNGGNTNVSTIDIQGGVENVELKNMTVTRGATLANTGSTFRVGTSSADVTIAGNEISGGPIGFFGSTGGVYQITDNTIRGAGDEGIWVADANTLDIRNNTIETTNDGDPGDDKIGLAVYYVDSHLILENNSIEATDAPLLLGNDIRIKDRATGTISALETDADMWSVLGRNSVNGTSPGKVAFVAQPNGTLRGESGSASGNVSTVHTVRTGITNVAGVGGSSSYSSSALEAAQDGDVLHLTDAATYSENVTLTSSPSNPSEADIDVGFASQGTSTLDTLGIEGAYTVDVPSGTFAVGDSLMTGKGSTLSGTPVVLSTGSVLADGGLVSGTLEATRSVGGGETVSFGNIGLTLSEDGGNNTPGQTTVTRTDGDPVTIGDGSIERYYDVEPTNTSNLNVDLAFEYDDGNIGDNELDANGLSESNLALFRSTDGGSTWNEEPPVSNFDESKNILEAQDLSSFSRFTAAESGSSLPVEMADLSAHMEGETVALEWATASEQGNVGFDVQRAVKENGSVGSFQKVGFVDGAGTSSSRTSYRFEDESLPYAAETLVYRLRQMDRDGTVNVTDPITVQKNSPNRSSLYGSVSNPVKDVATIRYELAQSAQVNIRVFNTLGQRVAQIVDDRKGAGRQSIQFETSGLPSGVYFIRMQTEGTTQTQRMTIVR